MYLNPYLTFNKNCREAFAFYEQALGATIQAVMTWGDSPMADEMPPEAQDMVMHAELEVGGFVIMGSDGAPGEVYEGIKGANVVFNTDTAEEAEALFARLGEGGEVTMPMEETFWALRFGLLRDRFGVPWMINCDKPQE